jgi:hypothetical protein
MKAPYDYFDQEVMMTIDPPNGKKAFSEKNVSPSKKRFSFFSSLDASFTFNGSHEPHRSQLWPFPSSSFPTPRTTTTTLDAICMRRKT